MSLAELAYQKITEKIIEGKYLPGDMLSENELAKELGMSRTPIRSAIAKLEDQGIFVSYKNKGILVKELSRKEMLDGLELTYALITYIFETRSTEHLVIDLEKLQHHLNCQKEAKANNDYISYVQHSHSFTKVILEAANNSSMLQIFNHHDDSSLLIAAINYNLNPQQSHYSAIPLNENLLQVIKAGEFDKVKKILMEHYENVRLRSFNERRI
ncbi:GntR family transcriptional regulator [Gracilibacillus suaedae]|uniref:GntR family transcriptional regulator n=1 Tax=Gracilibacillus suaedae TaxID=2820273 RepID=UPI001ABDDDF2|nr:GntR family transcriptional regulator [Gracilibacillus suaedae]